MPRLRSYLTTIAIAGFLLIVFSFASTVQAEEVAIKQNATAHNIPPKGFKTLFNGKDLEGWIGMNFHKVKGKSPVAVKMLPPKERKALLKKNWKDVLEHWSVDKGELVNDGKGVYLTTAKDYGDFELLLEYKTVAKADSGIYLRGVPQVQIWDTTKEGGKWDRKANLGSGGLHNNKEAGKHPTVHADKPFGEWNHFRIIMIGENVTVYYNHKLVVDNVPMENYYDRTRSIFPTGPIQLQTHGGEIRFRNVFIKEIPRKLPKAGILVDSKPQGKNWLRFVDGVNGAMEEEYWKLGEEGLEGTYKGGKGHHYAFTTRVRTDFELHANLKMTGKKPNSGFHFHVDPETAKFGKVSGYEIDLGEGVWGSLQHVGGDGNISKLSDNQVKQVFKKNDWNHLYLLVKGDYIQAWVNGVKVIDVENPRGPKKGSFALQLCGGERETSVKMKDVYIREIKTTVKVKPEVKK